MSGVRAQCTPDWIRGSAYPGLDGRADESVLWDPDGPGPQPEMLVICGEFDTVGGVSAHNVAAWDGWRWRALGPGFGERSSGGGCLGSCGSSAHVTVLNGDLYAVASTYGCSGIGPGGGCEISIDVLRWNGLDWTTATSVNARGSGIVHAVAAFQGELVIAGSFAWSGGPGRHVVRWNGQEWLPLGVSPNDGIDGTPYAMVVHEGRLIVSGVFTTAGGIAARNIASWDGQVWRPLGAGLGGEYGPYLLTVYDDALVAAGSFDGASGDPEHVARWDGAQWRPLSAGVTSPGPVSVYSLTVVSDELIVGGEFDRAGGVAVRGAASWNGAAWDVWDTGLENADVLGVYRGEVFAAGALVTPRGRLEIPITRWDGAAWRFFGDGLTATVTGLTTHSGGLYGAMRSVWMGTSSCNLPLVSLVSRWDGACWQPLEARSEDQPGTAAAITSFGADLVVGGQFATMGGVAAANVARWDGTRWHAMGEGLGAPLAGVVRALTVYEGRVIAGGTFRTTGAAAVERVAQWTGTGWAPMGAGFPHIIPGAPEVDALAVHNGALYAGGRFMLAGGRAGVARWDPAGAAWVPILPFATINDGVFALTTYGGELVAGGIVNSGETGDIPYIARWDGAQWRSLGGGLGPDPSPEPVYGYVDALAGEGATLVAGGLFARADGAPVNNVARWDGTRWHAMGSGVRNGETEPHAYLGSAIVQALAFHNGTLAAGGSFLFAGDHPSANFAEWRCTLCLADFDSGGSVTLQDLYDFLAAYFTQAPAADVNDSGSVTVQDVFDYLAAYFAGC